MDSTNSSILQSSNDGGDDEFDSRTNSLGSFQYSSTDATPGIATLQSPPQPLPLASSLNYHVFDSPSRGLDFTSLLADLPSSSPAPTISAGIDFGVSQSSSVQSHDKFRTTSVPQSSKKRTRASRRAPTTVLTTDTSNFRAMVQEFTGNPSPPPAAARSLHVSTRLSLLRSGVGFHDPPSPRQPQAPASFFQLPLPVMQTAQSPTSSAGAAQSQALRGMRSPDLALQSLLRPSFLANRTLPTMPAQFETRPRTPPPSGDALNELQLPRGLLAPEDEHSIYSGGDRNSGSQQRVIMNSTAFNLNYSGSNSPELSVEKGSAAETRGEGIVDSWICSSD